MGYSSTTTSHIASKVGVSMSTLTYRASTGGLHEIGMCPPGIDAWSDVTGTPHAALLKMSLPMPALTIAPDKRLSV